MNVNVYLSDIGDTENNETIQAIVKRSSGVWQQYALSGNAWTTTGTTYAYDPISGGGAAVASLSQREITNTSRTADFSINTTSSTVKRIDLNQLKYDIMNSVFNSLGVDSNSFEPDDIDLFIQGILVGIDDNVTFGLQQFLFGLPTAYDEYFFDAGKVLTDAAFLTYFSTLAGVSGGASVYLFAQAEVTATVGVIALAGGVTAPGGVIIEVGSLGSLAGGAGCAVVSGIATKAAIKSNNLLMASKNARNGLPSQNAGNFRTGLSNRTGTNPTNSHAHHILPQKFRNFFNRFSNEGINIHDPKYGSWVEKTKHLNEARAYNSDWEIWIRDNQSATLQMVIAKAKELALKYGYEIFF